MYVCIVHCTYILRTVLYCTIQFNHMIVIFCMINYGAYVLEKVAFKSIILWSWPPFTSRPTTAMVTVTQTVIPVLKARKKQISPSIWWECTRGLVTRGVRMYGLLLWQLRDSEKAECCCGLWIASSFQPWRPEVSIRAKWCVSYDSNHAQL